MKSPAKLLILTALAGLLVGTSGGYCLIRSLNNINNKEVLSNAQSKHGIAMARSGEPRTSSLSSRGNAEGATAQLNNTLSALKTEYDKYHNSQQNAIMQRDKALAAVRQKNDAAPDTVSTEDIRNESAKTTAQIQRKIIALTNKKNDIASRLKDNGTTPPDFNGLTSEHKMIDEAITELEKTIQASSP